MANDTMTISGAGRSVTITDEQLTQAAEQLSLHFPMDKRECAVFLDRYLTIEDEMDRLREEVQDLVESYKDFLPLRAVRTAIKVVRARKKLAEHHKEPMTYASQAQIEGFVQEHIAALDAAKQQAAEEAERSTRPVPDMTTGAGAV
jgi:hypothetical protein